MAKGKLAVLMCVGIGALIPGSGARAQQAFTGVDGCAVLAQLVYAEVTTGVWDGPGAHRQAFHGGNESAVTTCNHTTRTVADAFTLAMNAVGAEIRWGYPSSGSGDACLSHFLEQCYPERYPFGGVNPWQAVSGTVLRAMPRGAASDQSVFSERALRLALRYALAREYRQR